MRLVPLLLLVAGVAAAAPETGQNRPTAHAVLDTTATAVGGRLALTVEIEDSPGWVVEPPARNLDLSPFRIRSVREVPRPERRAWEFTLVPLEPGEHEIPEITFAVRGPGGSTGEIATEPVPVTVASNLPESVPGEDGAPPAPPAAAGLKPPLTAERNWWPLVAAAALFLLATVGGFFLFRKLRRRGPRPIPRGERPDMTRGIAGFRAVRINIFRFHNDRTDGSFFLSDMNGNAGCVAGKA